MTRHFVYGPTWLVDLEPGIEFRSSSPPSASYGPLAASVGPVPHLLLHPDNQSINQSVKPTEAMMSLLCHH